MDDREDDMVGYQVMAVGAIITIGCTLIATVTLVEKLMAQ
jgi:hypothetical protein